MALIFAIAFLAGGAVATATLAADEAPAITHYRSGYDLLKAEDYRNAAIELEMAIAADSTYMDAHYALGNAYRVLNQHSVAIRSLEAAGRHGMELPRMSGQLAKLYHRQALQLYKERKLVEAIDHFQRSLSHDDANAKALYVMGLSHSLLRDGEAAAGAFRRAVEVDPGYAKAYKSLGDLRRRIGNYGEAATLYGQAIGADAGLMEAYGGLAQVHLASENFEAAVKVIRGALELDPNYANGYVYLGMALNRLGRHNLSIEPLRKATDLDGKNAEAHYLLAEAYYGKADYQHAYDAGKRAVSSKRDYHAAQMLLGDICAKQVMVREAKSWYTKAMVDSRLKDYCRSKIEELDRSQRQ